MLNPDYAPLDGEQSVESPDGMQYVVRFSRSGVQRDTYYNWLPYVLSEMSWRLRRRRRWQVEVFRLGRIGLEYPPVLRERVDEQWTAETRASSLVREIGAGQVGWDRWHAPIRQPQQPDGAGS
jgi:hypothetical protein